MIHLKDFIESMTDQRLMKTDTRWKMAQFSFYVKKVNGQIRIVNTPY